MERPQRGLYSLFFPCLFLIFFWSLLLLLLLSGKTLQLEQVYTLLEFEEEEEGWWSKEYQKKTKKKEKREKGRESFFFKSFKNKYRVKKKSRAGNFEQFLLEHVPWNSQLRFSKTATVWCYLQIWIVSK